MWPMIYETTGMRCIRYSLFAFSFIFILTGIALVIIGSTINAINDEFAHFLSTSYFSPAILLVTLGFIIIGMATLGCFSAYKESTGLTMTFGMLLGLVAIFQVGVGLSANILMSQMDEEVQIKLNETMNSYNTDHESMKIMDNLQEELRCCGLTGPRDWDSIYANGTIPNSCCVSFKNGTCENTTNSGCRYVLKLIIKESTKILISSSYLLAFMEGFGMFFAFYLGKLLRQQKLARDYRRWAVRDQLMDNKMFQGGTKFHDFPSFIF